MPDFKANLIRERFVLKTKSGEEQISRGNRLEFECFDSKNEKPGKFVVRAQNMHTALRLAARLARHWYDHGDILTTGRNRFNWRHEYKETIKDFEDKWNQECWACIYRNGKLLFDPAPPEKSQLFDIIEQVYALEKGDYADIAAAAEKMFAKAGKKISLVYDGDLAMELEGSGRQINNKVTYRDTNGRNKIDLAMRQKDLRYVSGAKGTPVKLSECLSVAAVIFEGYQLGFTVGRVNYSLSSGQISMSAPEAQKADHAIKRILRLDNSLNNLTQKYHLVFKPKPNFQRNINEVENSFREKSRKF